jgi:hypothetical protein
MLSTIDTGSECPCTVLRHSFTSVGMMVTRHIPDAQDNLRYKEAKATSEFNKGPVEPREFLAKTPSLMAENKYM